jgi:hypothetical protein
VSHFYFGLLLMIVISVGCGQKSEITNAVEAQTMATQYGDGDLTVFPLIIPLTEKSIESFESPLNRFGFVSGFTKILMDTGAKFGMGKQVLTLEQPIYEFPVDYIKEARIKRVFFYLESKERKESTGVIGFIKDLPFFNGKGVDNFNFLNRLAVRVSSHEMRLSDSWMPIFHDPRDLERKDAEYLRSLFQRRHQVAANVVDAQNVRDLLLLTYDKPRRRDYLRNDSGKIYIIHTETPAKTRHFLEDHPKLRTFFHRIHLLNKSVLVELKKDPVVEEGFNIIMSEERETIDKLGLGVYDLHACDVTTCLDFKVSNVNLVPLMTRGNAIRLDTFIAADKVPGSFQLKGFVEFEVKVKLSF